MDNLLCDIDQIVVDIEQPMIDIYNNLTGHNLTKKVWDKYYLRDVSSLPMEKRVLEILYKQNFADLPLIPYAREGLASLAEYHNIYFATSRNPKKMQETVNMMRTHKIKYQDIIFNPDKAVTAKRVNAKLAFEDYWPSAVDLSSVCEVILFDYPYNRFDQTSRITRVPGFDDSHWWLNFMETK